MKQTNEDAVIKFLTDSRAHAWESFHIVMLDGSFFPPSTPIDGLLTAADKAGGPHLPGVSIARDPLGDDRETLGVPHFSRSLKL